MKQMMKARFPTLVAIALLHASAIVFAGDIDKNARWQIGQDSFAGARFVYTSNDAHEAASWLIAHGAHNQPRLADAGYLLREKGGPTIRQGTPEFDNWIEHNTASKLVKESQ